MSDAGSRLLLKFWSGTHGLNEELGRHKGREGKREGTLCGVECENVMHNISYVVGMSCLYVVVVD